MVRAQGRKLIVRTRKHESDVGVLRVRDNVVSAGAEYDELNF
jgi:hypothetical protein